MNARLLCIAFAFPCGDLGGQEVLVVPPTIQALAIHDANFRFRHVQPTAVFGRVMKLDLVQETSSLLGSKRFIQARAIVCSDCPGPDEFSSPSDNHLPPVLVHTERNPGGYVVP